MWRFLGIIRFGSCSCTNIASETVWRQVSLTVEHMYTSIVLATSVALRNGLAFVRHSPLCPVSFVLMWLHQQHRYNASVDQEKIHLCEKRHDVSIGIAAGKTLAWLSFLTVTIAASMFPPFCSRAGMLFNWQVVFLLHSYGNNITAGCMSVVFVNVAMVHAKPICRSGGCQTADMETPHSPRPWTILWTPVHWPSSKVVWYNSMWS